jgi:hypothetical protein
MLTYDKNDFRRNLDDGFARLPRSLIGCAGELRVRVAYSDETGTGSIEKEPITVVAAIVMNLEDQWEGVEHDLSKLAPREDFEFKGAKLFKQLRKANTRAEADRMLRGVLAVPGRNRLPVYHVAVDRKGFIDYKKERGQWESMDAYDAAFFICLNQIEMTIHTYLPKERLLWISDHGGHYEKRFKLMHSLLRTAQEYEVFPGTDAARKSCLVDTVYFGNSNDSRALQLADVCASTLVLHEQKDPIASPYYDLIQFRVMNRAMPIYFTDGVFNALDGGKSK